MSDDPYIEIKWVDVERVYNPNYGDDRICGCGHPYHRHFDSHEDMAPVGCKYCDCYTFIERPAFHTRVTDEQLLISLLKDGWYHTDSVNAAIERLEKCIAEGLRDYSVPEQTKEATDNEN